MIDRDGLGNITERHPDLNAEIPTHDLAFHPQLLLTDKAGPELALELIRSRPTKSITYIALGPLTNLAQAMRLDAATVRDRIGRVVCMGGALDVPGNTSPMAECECFFCARSAPWQ
jgi:inosine-uridine nucleoside N-ribohydrolase